MKYSKLLFALLFVATAFAFVAPTPAAADFGHNTASCSSMFDGTQLKVKNGQLVIPSSYSNGNCSKKGSGCSVVPSLEGGKLTGGIISCPNGPATGAKCISDTACGSKTAGSGGISDPAMSSNNKCTADNCPFVDQYINPAINLLSALVGIAAVVGIIFGSIQVTTSAGDPQKAANGKSHIRNALIGLVAYALLWWFLQWVIPGGIG